MDDKMKTCLKCRKQFESEGKFNRLCWKCNHTNDNLLNIVGDAPPSRDGRVIRKNIDDRDN